MKPTDKPFWQAPSPNPRAMCVLPVPLLPPAFLLLVVLNCLFLGVIAWVFDHNAETRNALLTKIVERCLVQQREPR
jgi:hypothetical protein